MGEREVEGVGGVDVAAAREDTRSDERAMAYLASRQANRRDDKGLLGCELGTTSFGAPFAFFAVRLVAGGLQEQVFLSL